MLLAALINADNATRSWLPVCKLKCHWVEKEITKVMERDLKAEPSAQTAGMIKGAERLGEMGMPVALPEIQSCNAAKARDMLRTLLARLSRAQPSEARQGLPDAKAHLSAPHCCCAEACKAAGGRRHGGS